MKHDDFIGTFNTLREVVDRKPVPNAIHVVFYEDDERTKFAHCLEYDLLAHGDTEQEALESLIEVITAQAECLEEMGLLDNMVHPAPLEYWRMLKDGHHYAVISGTLDESVHMIRMKILGSATSPARIQFEIPNSALDRLAAILVPRVVEEER